MELIARCLHTKRAGSAKRGWPGDALDAVVPDGAPADVDVGQLGAALADGRQPGVRHPRAVPQAQVRAGPPPHAIGDHIVGEALAEWND